MPARVIAYHLIVTAYGFWLPNDPRGSWSDFVRSWELARFGPATKTDEKRSLARKPHDAALRRAAKLALARPPVDFTGLQARAISRGFADYAARSGCLLFACAILPSHSHLVVGRHTCSIEMVARLLKGAATTRLLQEGLHPFADQPYANGRLPTPWAHNEWSCFLDSASDIIRAVKYVEGNPLKERKRAQRWGFVKSFHPDLLRHL